MNVNKQVAIVNLFSLALKQLVVSDPAIDAEVISLAMYVYQKAGLKDLKLVINSLGDKESK